MTSLKEELLLRHMKKDTGVRILLTAVILFTGGYYIQQSISTQQVASAVATRAHADTPVGGYTK